MGVGDNPYTIVIELENYLLFEGLVMFFTARKGFDECCNLFDVPLGDFRAL